MPLNLPPPKASTSSLPASEPATIPAPAPTRGLNLPAPTSVGAAVSSSATSSAGPKLPPPKTKKAGGTGPKKFVLDLPKPSRNVEDGLANTTNDEPAAKKPRLNGNGLSALLPEPSTPAATGTGGLKLPEPKPAGSIASTAPAASRATTLLPHALKGKGKASAASEQRARELREADQAEKAFDQPLPEAPEEPALDFFGLATTEAAEPAVDFFGLGGPSTVVPTTSSSSVVKNVKVLTAAPSESAKPKFSAAPTTAAPSLSSNYYATLPVPSKDDPYPGFYQKADGSWAAKRPEEWEVWAAAHGWGEQTEAEAPKKKEKEYNMPADFDQSALGDSIEIRAAALRGKDAEDSRPSKIPEEDRKKMEADKAAAAANQKKFSHAARSRHQLSTLIASARDNRAELEDRIAQMKANKRTGGSKYGF